MTVDELIDRLSEMPGWAKVVDTAGSEVIEVREHWGDVMLGVLS